MATKVLASGELLVTGNGEVVIDEVLPRTRAILVQPELYIFVEFDPNESCPPPCAGGGEDELDWELFFKQVHPEHRHRGRHGKEEEELRLKICWHVQTARTIVWRIKVPT